MRQGSICVICYHVLSLEHCLAHFINISGMKNLCLFKQIESNQNYQVAFNE